MSSTIKYGFFFILLVSLASCETHSGMHISLDMQFDTVVTCANGSNSMMIKSIKQDHEDEGRMVVSLKSFIYDHDGAFCSATRVDSLIKEGVDTIVYHYECGILKDTVYVFDGTPVKFKIPVNESAWGKNDDLKEKTGSYLFYDSCGHIVMKKGNGIVEEFIYDENGYCVLEKANNGYSIVTKENTYNNRGYLIQSICYINDTIEYTLYNKYNRKGKIRKRRQQMYKEGVLLDGSYNSDMYRYDNHGRMIEKHELFFNNDRVIINRNLIYRYDNSAGSITMRTKNILHPEGTYSDVFRYYSVFR